MYRTWTSGIVATVLVSIASSGCLRVYRAETVLGDDGAVERSVYQPEPLGRGWQESHLAPSPQEMETKGWPAHIRDIPSRRSSNSNSQDHHVAWGRFPSPKEIPDQVVIRPEDQSGLPEGKLKREYVRRDLVFVVEHQWRETLTDIVTLEGMRQAREELADLVIEYSRDVLNEAAGSEYDFSRLVKWMRSEGKSWWTEITDYAFVHAASHKGSAALDRLWDGAAAICARHGLVLATQGKYDELEKPIDKFLNALISNHVRRKQDGKPVDEQVRTAWVKEWLGPVDPRAKKRPAFRAAAEVVKRGYGGSKAFDKRVGSLLIHVTGLYLLSPVPCPFDYTLTLPGEVVEANGQMLSCNRVRWQFDAREAFPLGYDMSCRSLVARPEVQQQLLKAQLIRSREEMLEYANLVGRDERLLEVLQKCRHQKGMTPLHQYRGTLSPEAERNRADQLLRVLKLARR